MVHRIARAIVIAIERGAWPLLPSDYEPPHEDIICGYLDARAAILAMRKVTNEMEDAGINRLDEIAGDNNVQRHHLIEAYQAMIDAALKE